MAIMSNVKSTALLVYSEKQDCYECQGTWSIGNLAELCKRFEIMPLPEKKRISISGKPLNYFDSAGALALQNFANSWRKKGKEVQFIDFATEHKSLLALIDEEKATLDYQVQPPPQQTLLHRIGEETVHKIDQAQGVIVLVGDLCIKIVESLGHWRHFRFPSIVSNIESTGIQALPIVALLSFLIGVVLAYQMGLQLQTYGASIFIAYLSGMAIFREFAPLITAIIVAGRTSSAFTAQLGSMKINEEIDAIKTMGLSPTQLLVMPKVIGLLIVFPLLIFWGDFFSILGAMFMSKWMLNVGHADFLARLKESVGLQQLMLGLYKAPAFALIISLVGCFQGFAVEANADSIGSQTTKSVVQALFLIIIADAIFSVVYSWMDL
jgi:phospholipid/cholesterol/gamma-HCH transport system permease protein